MTSCPPRSTSEAPRRAEQAHDVCLRLLTARARSRSELSAALGRRGYPDDVVDAVLGRLAEVGLIDDTAFARQWVRSRRASAGRGRRALVAELRGKGVDDEVIAAAVDEVDPAAWRTRAEELVRTRLRREDLDGELLPVARRLAGMLARRGYPPAMAHDVVKTELDCEVQRRRA